MYALPTFQAAKRIKMKVMIIVGHPEPGSLAEALAEAYAEGWRGAGGEAHFVRLHSLAFDACASPRTMESEPEAPALVEARSLLMSAKHVAVFAPVWWGVYPAILHGFLSRLLVAGQAYKYNPDGSWQKLLKGRTGRVVMTMDAPTFFQQLFYSDPGGKALKRAIFWFCGIWPVKVTRFGRVLKSTPEMRAQWLAKVKDQGASDAKWVSGRG
jgi:putative NADPH-quinone reductase